MKIVILTCDKHAWLVPVYLHFFKKNWRDNPYKIEIVTETDRVDGTVFYSKEKSWAGRLIKYLEQCKRNKVLLTLEDYFIKNRVDSKKIRIAEDLCGGDVGCVRLNNIPHKYFERHTTSSDIKGFREYPPDKRYSMVVQMAIFQTQFLLDVLRSGESIWQTEGKGSERLGELKSKWRIIWPETNIVDYMSDGGLIKKGKPRLSVVQWALMDLIKCQEY